MRRVVLSAIGCVIAIYAARPLTLSGDQAVTSATATGQQPQGLAPNLGRPSRDSDEVPLFDFEKYFLGRWTFEADAPDTVLGAGGPSSGAVTYRKLDQGFYEATTEGKGEGGAFRIKETFAYQPANKSAFRHVTDSRGFSYVQAAEVGGNIGGDYYLFFMGAPFTFKGKTVRLNHRIHVVTPLVYRIDVELSTDGGPFLHMSPWRFTKALDSKP
ncbi:MAG: hypothetical protein ABMA15_01095 [Vicinamibacterales bacterium]